MSNATTISPTLAQQILTRIDRLEKAFNQLIEAIEEVKEPPYGSDAWWEWSNKRAKQSIQEGKGIKVRNEKELAEFFKSL